MPKELVADSVPHNAKSVRPAAREPYVLQRDVLAAASPSLVSQWQRFHTEHSADDPMRDPEWLRGYFEGQINNLSFYSLMHGGEVCGLVPFLRRDWPLLLQFGAWSVADLPLTRMRLLGTGLNFPDDEAAYDLLFSELAKSGSGFDAVYLEGVPIDSFLWRYLHDSRLIRRSFLSYSPSPPSPRPVLRLEGSYEQYLGKFNSKHRNTIARKIKKLRDGALGEMRLVRYEAPEEVDTFLDQAVEISKKTYQWALHGRGLSMTSLLRDRLAFAAQRGWMRSYLLFCGDEARAFLLGFQYNGRFLLHETGFDPELAKHSVGTVLQMLTVEDLFNCKRPHIFDLEDYGAYKEVLATESYDQGKLFLFRPSLYARFARAGHRACDGANRAASTVLDKLNLKTKIKQRVRGWSASR